MTMTGIKTKFFGPTNTRGSRIRASLTNSAGWCKNSVAPTVTVPYSSGNQRAWNHVFAARKLAEKMGWGGVWVSCDARDGMIFTRLRNTGAAPSLSPEDFAFVTDEPKGKL